MKVIETFDSIQGEGTMLGQVATFVRLAGCNLRCPWCDTKDSWNPRDSIIVSIEEIVQACNKENVIITGGEPCIDPRLFLLVQALKKENHYVCIETNGTFETPVNADWITCSPKPEVNYEIHPECHYNELKYVVTEDMDLHKIILPVLQNTNVPVWLQPNGYDLKNMTKKIFDFVVEQNNPQIKMGIQLHKIYRFQ